MTKRVSVLFLAAIVLTSAVSACSSGIAKDTTTGTVTTSATQETTSAVQTTGAAQTTTTQTKTSATTETTTATTLVEESMVSEIVKPLTGMIMTYGQIDFNQKTQITNEQAIMYLEQMARVFYSDRAAKIDVMGTQYKYVAFDETETDQLLNEAFGGRYSTKELLTENTDVVYNAHKYYVPIVDGADAPVIQYVSSDTDTNQYTFSVQESAKTTKVTLTIQASEGNTIGFSIVSFTFG
jgi:hypothetical protein